MKFLILVFFLIFTSSCFSIDISYWEKIAVIFVDTNHSYLVQPEDLNVGKIEVIRFVRSYYVCRQLIYTFTAIADAGVVSFDLNYETGMLGLESKDVNLSFFFN